MPRDLPPAILRCRAATADRHRRLEDALDPAWLAADPQRLDRWLLGLLRAHRRAEAALGPGPWTRWPGLYRSRDLRADLTARGVPLPGTIAACHDAPHGGDDDDIGWNVGVLYVLEGSALGAPSIRRTLSIVTPGRSPAPRFLHTEPSPGRRWRRLCELAGQVPRHGGEDRAAAGAAAAFSWFEAELADLRQVGVTE